MKKTLVLLLSVVMVISMLPAAAFAAETQSPFFSIRSEDKTVHVGETNEDILGDGTAAYDKETNTLTLSGYQFVNGDAPDNPAIYVYKEQELNIVLMGENVIEHGQPIVAQGNLNISGEGSLTVKGGAYGIQVMDNSLVLDGVKVTASNTERNSCIAADTIKIINGAEITAESGAQDGISSTNNIIIKDSKVKAISTFPISSGNYWAGIRASNGITINNSEVEAAGSDFGISCTLGKIEIAGSVVNAKAVDENGNAAIKAPSIAIKEKSIVDVNSEWLGIDSVSELTISESKVTAKAADSGILIEESGKIDIQNSIVELDATYGIWLNDGVQGAVSGSWIETSGEDNLEGNANIENSVYINNGNGEVSGSVILPGDVTIKEGTELEFTEDSEIIVPNGTTLTNNGTITGSVNITNNGEVVCSEHSLTKIERKEATTEAEGNIEYWKCDVCKKLFADETAAKEIELKDTVIPKLNPPSYFPTLPSTPTAQKPIIEAEDGADVKLSEDGTKAQIEVEKGATLKDVILNGKSLGAVTKVDNLKTGDKLVVIVETSKEKKARIIDGVENTDITLSYRKNEIGKGWIKVRFKKEYGYKVDYYEVFRSAKTKNHFGKKAWFVAKTNKTGGFYRNNKEIKKGTKYYYKIRGVREIDGKLYYTKWSNIVMRTGR